LIDYNDLLPTGYGLVGRVANKSAATMSIRGSYGETCVMDLGHNIPMTRSWHICATRTSIYRRQRSAIHRSTV